MSHDATNWAIKVRGLKPAAKIVLWHLADYYNPEHGCFPSQDRLADDCEMSRASINVQLNTLEVSGLIRREKRVDPVSKQQKSTFYILNFGVSRVQNLDTEAVSRKQTEPCPDLEQTRVQNLDTNPVIEPVREPVMPPEAVTASPSDDLDKVLYQRGKAVLGSKAGSQITKLKKIVGTGKALELIDLASRKENPNEYIAGVIHNEADNGHSKSVATIESAAKFADTILADRAATGIRY